LKVVADDQVLALFTPVTLSPPEEPKVAQPLTERYDNQQPQTKNCDWTSGTKTKKQKNKKTTNKKQKTKKKQQTNR